MSTPLLIVVALVVFAGLLVVAAFIGTARFRATSRTTAESLAQAHDARSAIITEADLARLPEPVARWLRRSGVPARASVVGGFRSGRYHQSGRIRQDVNGGWMDFAARQYVTAGTPGFVWTAEVTVAGIPVVSVRDSYIAGRGRTLVSALGLVAMQSVEGEAMDKGALQRYLGELGWMPAAALQPGVHWEAVDARRARASLSDEGATVDGVFEFDDNGDLIGFSTRRYRMVADGFVETDQTFSLSEHATVDGIRIPRRATAVWHLPDGDVQTIDMRIDEAEYD